MSFPENCLQGLTYGTNARPFKIRFFELPSLAGCLHCSNFCIRLLLGAVDTASARIFRRVDGSFDCAGTLPSVFYRPCSPCLAVGLAAYLATRYRLRPATSQTELPVIVWTRGAAGDDCYGLPLHRAPVLLQENLYEKPVNRFYFPCCSAPHIGYPRNSDFVGALDGLPGMPITVKQALTKVNGVIQAKVDFDKHRATVTFDDAKTDVQALSLATKTSAILRCW